MKFYQSFNKKNQSKKYSAGFTLIELILAASLMGIVITVSGWGLSAILLANERAEAESIVTENLSRALDFISDDVRTANLAVGSPTLTSPTITDPPSWEWSSDLGSTATAKLYLQIPLSVQTMNALKNVINLPGHGFTKGNAIMFTGTGTIAGGLLKDKVYYVYKDDSDLDTDDNNFKLSTTLTDVTNNTTIDLTSDSTGTMFANRLVIYFIRTNTNSWLAPRTVNRSVGPCNYASTNCPALVDAIYSSTATNNSTNATKNGFTAIVSNKQVTLYLTGRLNKTPKTQALSTTAFMRSN